MIFFLTLCVHDFNANDVLAFGLYALNRITLPEPIHLQLTAEFTPFVSTHISSPRLRDLEYIRIGPI